jgi:AraC-like DNA-binding protein
LKNMDTPPVYQFLATPGHALVEGVWRLETGPGADDIAPDSCCEIIFHLAEPPMEKIASGWKGQPRRMIYGPLTRVLKLRRASQMVVMAIRLKPQGIGAMTDSPRKFRNRSCDLTALLPPVLISRLEKAAHSELQAFGETAQASLLSPPGWEGQAIRTTEAMRILDQDPSIRAIDLAASMNISRRTLDRDFMRHTGLTPGEFTQIHRYQSARAQIGAGELSLSDIAALSGYSDQAHMTREFRRFAGKTPRLKRGEDGSDVFYDNV